MKFFILYSKKVSNTSYQIQNCLKNKTTSIVWLVTGTLRENVIFGAPHTDEALYQAALACTGLDEDFKLFPEGDQTVLGERGANLSGGQRIRVALARAVYSKFDFVLLDDPLSALDSKLQEFVFEECFCKQLAGKTRVLVTHQLQYLNRVERVLVVGGGGKIVRDSPYCTALLASEEYQEVAGQSKQSGKRG